MHVLIPVLHRPTHPTGVCRHAANLAQGLSERAEVSQVTLVTGNWQADYFETEFGLRSPKITVLRIAITNRAIARNRWYLLDLPRLANQLQADVVHLAFPIPLIRRWFNAPVVATIHDLYPYECPENFGFPKVLFNRWFLDWCVNRCDGLCCVSQGTLEGLKHYFPSIHQRKPTAVIYNCVDLSTIAPQIPCALPFGAETPFILCVAQHRKNKNLDLLIQSFANLLQDGSLSPATYLCLVGSAGPETETLLNLTISLGIRDQVVLLSGLQDGELRWLYEHCLLFAIASATEGFCLPLVEALSLGCRVVCSNIPIFREVGSSACHYFTLGDQAVPNLVGAIKSAIAQPQPDSTSIDSRFSKSYVTEQYLKFYRCVSVTA